MTDESHPITSICIDAINAITDLRRFAGLCERGLNAKEHDRVTTRLVNILVKHKIFDSKYALEWEGESEIYAFADSQKDAGNPLLYEMLILKLYSTFESAIDYVVLACLRSRDISLERMEKMKISIRDVFGDRMDYAVLEAIKRELANSQRGPLSRLERMLELVNCSFDAPKTVTDGLYDFVCNRNLIAHKNSTVDLWFRKQCAYIEIEPGGKVVYNRLHFAYYYLSVVCYLTLLARSKDEASNRDDIVELNKGLLEQANSIALALYPLRGTSAAAS